MSDVLHETFGPLLIDAGFVHGFDLPDSVIYTAAPTIERDPSLRGAVMLTVTSDAFVLMTFVAPTERFSAEQVDAVRDSGDGYSRTALDDSWALGERIDGGIIQDFQDWETVATNTDLVVQIRNFLVARVTALAQYVDLVQQRLSSPPTQVDREAIFGPVQRVLDEPSLVADGHVDPEVFVQVVRAAFTAAPEQEMFAQVYGYVRGLSMQALAAGSTDSPWFVVSDGLGDLQKEWGWSD